MPRLRVPSYRLHKQSGQAVVTLNGKDVLLGKHDPLLLPARFASRSTRDYQYHRSAG